MIIYRTIIVLVSLTAQSICYADQSIDLFRIACPKGAGFVDVGIISVPDGMPAESKKKLVTYDYYQRNKNGKIEHQCTIAGKLVNVNINFNPPHPRRCGGNPGANITVQLDGFPLIDRQPLHSTCQGPGIMNFSLNEYELVFCASSVSYEEANCERVWVSDIRGGKRRVSIKHMEQK